MVADISDNHLRVDADIGAFGEAGVLVEGPELLQSIQVTLLKVLCQEDTVNHMYVVRWLNPKLRCKTWLSMQQAQHNYCSVSNV